MPNKDSLQGWTHICGVLVLFVLMSARFHRVLSGGVEVKVTGKGDAWHRFNKKHAGVNFISTYYCQKYIDQTTFVKF